MKTRTLGVLLASVCLLLAACQFAAADENDVHMTVIATGGMRKLGGYRPQLLKLSDEKPAELKKAPKLESPKYGQIHFGDRSYVVVLDEPQGKDATLYVDSNGNGDLTDDPATEWKPQSRPGGPKFMGSFQLPLQAGKPQLVSLGAYQFDPSDPQRRQLKDVLIYFSDYVYDGRVTLNGTQYHAMLTDMNATGDFKTGKGVKLFIDVNNDGKFSPRGEMFDVDKPFNIKGTTYELAGLNAGGDFKIEKSKQEVAEIPAPPDLSVGKTIPSFKATTMDGKEVNFPADYKGKLVMLDFWATWCGPCMGEVPGLVKAYNEYHPKGFDVLGISLDQPNAADKVKSVTGEKGMTWPQVYDGKFWQARIAEMYGIQSIPAPFLVDGDTGKIIASHEQLRGENLPATLQKALTQKSRTAG